MPFLRLNGWTIPVAGESSSMQPIDIGTRERSFGGELLTDRRAKKRRWSFRTTLLTEMVGKAVEGTIRGLGQFWPFDTFEDWFSTKGRGKESTFSAFNFGVSSVNSKQVLDLNGVTEGPRTKTAAIHPHPAFTNAFTSNQADVETDTTGFAPLVPGSITQSNVEAVHGTGSLRLLSPASGGGFITAFNTVAVGTHTVSFYVNRTTGSGALTIEAFGNSTGSLGAATPFTPASPGSDVWERFQLTATTLGGDTAINFEIRTPVGVTIAYFDAFQLVPGSLALPWVNGIAATTDLSYSIERMFDDTPDYTMNFWAALPTANPTTTQTLLFLSNAAGNIEAAVYRSASVNSVTFETADTTGIDMMTAGSPWDDGWHMVTAVGRRNPETGEFSKELYVDGVSIASSNNLTPDAGLFTKLDVGHAGTVLPASEAHIGEVLLVPWAAPSSQVTSWYNMGVGLSPLPRVYADGDIMVAEPLTLLVEGEVGNVSKAQATLDGNSKPNAQRIAATLTQV